MNLNVINLKDLTAANILIYLGVFKSMSATCLRTKAFIEKNDISNIELSDYLKLVQYYIRKLREKYNVEYSHTYSEEDALSDGILSFYEAKRRYNPNLSKFSTYLFYYVKKNFLSGYRSSSLVYVPKSKKVPYLHGFTVDVDEINMQYENGQSIHSFDDINKITNMNIKEEVYNDILNDELVDLISKTLNILNKKQRNIIRMYYGIGCERKTADQISNEFHMTKAAVWSQVQQGLRILRNYLRSEFPEVRY